MVVKAEALDADLSELCTEWLAEGRRNLAAGMHAIVRREDAGLAQALRQSGGAGLHEPLLYARLHYGHARAARQPCLSLSQIAFGYLDPALQPGAIGVLADVSGRVCLPGVGHLLSEARVRELRLSTLGEAGAHVLTTPEGVEVPFTLLPPLACASGRVEIVRHGDPLYSAVFRRDDGSAAGRELGTEVDCQGERYTRVVARSFELLREHLGCYYEPMVSVTRQVFVFDEPEVLSFARLSAHGAVFINARGRSGDESHFVCELVCRSAVTLLASMIPQPKRCFDVDPYMRLDEHGITWGGDRNLYTALHGMFYEYLMTRCLEVLHERRVFSGRLAHEVWGRLAFLHSRFRYDIHELMLHGGVLSERGRELYRPLAAAIHRLREARTRCSGVDLTSQVAAFDYARFVERNPEPADRL
ncbi:MAG TPA: hypothetical protein VNN80_31120 [Polyangiaceae bacterium]|nr:hypothetical protein [Polyangiaceae bacterium]